MHGHRDVFGGFLLHDVEDVVEGDDAEHSAVGIHHRNGDEVVAGQEVGRDVIFVRETE